MGSAGRRVRSGEAGHSAEMGCCCGKEEHDPKDEYEVYVKELKDQIETLDREIEERSKEQKELQREMEEIDPECVYICPPSPATTHTHPLTRNHAGARTRSTLACCRSA